MLTVWTNWERVPKDSAPESSPRVCWYPEGLAEPLPTRDSQPEGATGNSFHLLYKAKLGMMLPCCRGTGLAKLPVTSQKSRVPWDWLHPSWQSSKLGTHVSRSSGLLCPFTQ